MLCFAKLFQRLLRVPAWTACKPSSAVFKTERPGGLQRFARILCTCPGDSPRRVGHSAHQGGRPEHLVREPRIWCARGPGRSEFLRLSVANCTRVLVSTHCFGTRAPGALSGTPSWTSVGWHVMLSVSPRLAMYNGRPNRSLGFKRRTCWVIGCRDRGTLQCARSQTRDVQQM